MSATYYGSAKFKQSRARTARRRYWRNPEKGRQRLRDYRAHNKPKPIKCARCGDSVSARRSTRRYCSGACRVAAWRKRRQRFARVRDAELLDHIQALDDVMDWVDCEASTESEEVLYFALRRVAEFLVDLREQRHNGGGAASPISLQNSKTASSLV